MIFNYVQKRQSMLLANMNLDFNDDEKIESLSKIMSEETSESKEELNMPQKEEKEHQSNNPSFYKLPKLTSPGIRNTSPGIRKKAEFKQRKSKEEIIDLKDTKEGISIQEIDPHDQRQNKEFNTGTESFEIYEKTQKNFDKSLKKIPTNFEEIQKFNYINNFECMKLFTKYQPNFNFNVVIMLLNKEYYYRMKQKSGSRRRRRNQKKNIKSSIKLSLTSARKKSNFSKK